MNNNLIRVIVASVVAAVWGASYIVSIVNHAYHPPPELNGVMLLVAGYFFATGIRDNERQSEIKREVEDELARRRPRLRKKETDEQP